MAKKKRKSAAFKDGQRAAQAVIYAGMRKVYLVYSACEDQEQTFVDVVVARTEEEATKKVQRLRGRYAFTDYAGTLDEHIEFMQGEQDKSLAEIERGWRQLCRSSN